MSVKEMIVSSNPLSVTKTAKVDVADESFLETMQKMVGGETRAAKSQFCTKKCDDVTLKKTFQELVFRNDGSTTITPRYEKYNYTVTLVVCI